MSDGVSFIICTHNGSTRLPAVLDHLAAQYTPQRTRWEVIVVDNASTDDSATIARRHWSRPAIPFRTVSELQPGLSYARMRGLAEARYGIVSFIDDDNWVSTDWLTRITELFDAHPDVGAVGGFIQPVFETPAPDWFDRAKERYAMSTYEREFGQITGESGFLSGAGLTIRKQAWEQLQAGGFQFQTVDRQGNNLSSGGDTELCYAIRLAGWNLWFEPTLILEHFVPAHRLQWSYARRLYGGCASCSAILQVYIQVLQAETLPCRTPWDFIRAWGHRTWQWHAVAALIRLSLMPKSLFRARFSLAEGDFGVLDVEEKISRLWAFLHYRSQYRQTLQYLTEAPWRSYLLKASAHSHVGS